jgi:DNA replication and repair protein RecF
MYIKKLNLTNFRNFKTASVNLCNGMNYFYGKNGSGKTSIIESIYYLSLARSFRTNKNSVIINHDSKELTIFADLISKQSIEGKLGLTRDLNGHIIVKYNGEYVEKVSFLANVICIQLIAPDTFMMFDGGPNLRREFIDWGCFYHFPNYGIKYFEYKKILKQRNALLQSKTSESYLSIWDKSFIEASIIINNYRNEYLSIFNEKAGNIINSMLPDSQLSIELISGFKTDPSSFEEQLKKSRDREYLLGYSLFGPHKSDLKVKSNNDNVIDVFSRGQQKLLITSMRLAQGELYQDSSHNNCVYLIDDITSELDDISKLSLFNYINLHMNNSQFIITSLNKLDTSMFNNDCTNNKMFHVEQNEIIENNIQN